MGHVLSIRGYITITKLQIIKNTGISIDQIIIKGINQ